MAEIEKLLKSLECSVRPYKKRDNCKECKYRLLEKVDSRIPCPPDVEENGVKYWESCDCDRMVKDAIRTIRELQEDCNRYHEWGMHEGYEEAKEKYKCKYWNTEHKECSQGNTIVIDEVCEWKLFDEETNAYNTTCGGAFWFNDGSPKDNGFKYCPYCGRKLRWWSND